jgi:hypothetical protein
MKVALEVSALAHRGTGIARYAGELLLGLLERQPPLDVEILSNRPLTPEALPDSVSAAPRRHGMVPSRALWMHAVLPYVLTRTGADLCHFTNSEAPLVRRIKQVVTVHDVSLLRTPEMHPRSRVLRLGRLMSVTARRDRRAGSGGLPGRPRTLTDASAAVYRRSSRECSALAVRVAPRCNVTRDD